ATLLRGAGRFAEAADQFAVLVTLLPGNPTMRVGLVTFLRAAGREQEARSAQAAAERLFPTDAGVRQMRQLLGGCRARRERKRGKDGSPRAGYTEVMTDTLERIQRVVDFMEAHLFEDLPLATIADRGACSPWHFHRVFQSLTGETPAGYVWKRRLSEICRRLIETRQPLVDVALDCGFESQATFTRAFTRHVGVAPGRFRSRHPHSLPAYLYPRLDLETLMRRQRLIQFLEPRIVRRPAF